MCPLFRGFSNLMHLPQDHLRVSLSSLGQDLGICIANKYPWDPKAADPRAWLLGKRAQRSNVRSQLIQSDKPTCPPHSCDQDVPEMVFCIVFRGFLRGTCICTFLKENNRALSLGPTLLSSLWDQGNVCQSIPTSSYRMRFWGSNVLVNMVTIINSTALCAWMAPESTS